MKQRLDLVVIDDEFPVLYTIRAIMEEHFPGMETFTDPREGLRTITQTGARVVITDLRMPEMSGLEVLTRTLAADPDIQVIMLTAHGSEKVAVEAMKQGAFHYITKPFDPEEMKMLVNKALEQYALRKSIAYDREMARNLQLNLLPQHNLESAHYRIAFEYIPGGVVGGDFFDFFEMPDGRLGIIIADAAGHGVASAMLMAMLKIAFHNTAQLCHDPAALLTFLNRQFQPIIKSPSYFTACYGILEPSPPRFTFSIAGHPAPLIYRPAEDRFLPAELTAMALGLFPDSIYENLAIPLQPGDVICLYTDGLSESCKDENFFHALRTQLHQISYDNQGANCAQLVSRITQRAESGEDDLTLIIIQL